MKISTSELEGRGLPPIFINVVRRKNYVECQTLELMKRNQKVRLVAFLLATSTYHTQINLSHQEVILMSTPAMSHVTVRATGGC
jgi:DNA mismatch repair protein MSH4